MRRLASTKAFQKELGAFLRKYPDAEERVEKVFSLLRRDVFAPALKTHKLSGKLNNLYACSVNYAHRVVFVFDDEQVYLLSIGSHDEVY